MNKQRTWERHIHDKRLEMIFPDGRHFMVESHDISISGLFVKFADVKIPEVNEKEVGTLRVTSGESVHHFSCQVIRVTRTGLALHLTEQQAEFGFAISQDIFFNLNKKRSKA